jgi:hypothetical protein
MWPTGGIWVVTERVLDLSFFTGPVRLFGSVADRCGQFALSGLAFRLYWDWSKSIKEPGRWSSCILGWRDIPTPTKYT